MRRVLKVKPELEAKLIPSFGVGCRRITPGVGYLEALVQDNVECVFGSVSRLTKNGIVGEDGIERAYDVISAFNTLRRLSNIESGHPKFARLGSTSRSGRDSPSSVATVGSSTPRLQTTPRLTCKHPMVYNAVSPSEASLATGAWRLPASPMHSFSTGRDRRSGTAPLFHVSNSRESTC